MFIPFSRHVHPLCSSCPSPFLVMSIPFSRHVHPLSRHVHPLFSSCPSPFLRRHLSPMCSLLSPEFLQVGIGACAGIGAWAGFPQLVPPQDDPAIRSVLCDFVHAGFQNSGHAWAGVPQLFHPQEGPAHQSHPFSSRIRGLRGGFKKMV